MKTTELKPLDIDVDGDRYIVTEYADESRETILNQYETRTLIGALFKCWRIGTR